YAVVLTPTPVADVENSVSDGLRDILQRPFVLYVNQIDVGRSKRASETAQIAAAQASEQRRTQEAAIEDLARSLALISGVDRQAILLDRVSRRAVVTAAPLTGATLATYRELEQRAAATMPGWEVRLLPPVLPLSPISFDGDSPDEAGRAALATAVWAGQRLRLPISVSGPSARVERIVADLASTGVLAQEGPARAGSV